MTVLKYWDTGSASYKTLTGPPGPQGPQGDIGPAGAQGPGLPTGGSVAQVPVKNSTTNYDMIWGGPMLPLAGGTLTGSLIISTATFPTLTLDSPAGSGRLLQGKSSGVLRWNLALGNSTPESTGNVGSDFSLQRYSDAGTFIDAPLTVNRATGLATFGGQITVSPAAASAILSLMAPASVYGASVMLYSSAGQAKQLVIYSGANLRWILNFGLNPEGGSNAGSDVRLDRFNDAGTFIDSPLSIMRSNGAVSFNSGANHAINGMGATSYVAPAAAVNAQLVLNKAGSGATSGIYGFNNAAARWAILFGNSAAESTGNVGSDFNISRYSDAGTPIDTPLSITRASGAVTIGGSNPTVTIGASGPTAILALSAAAGTNRFLRYQTSGSDRWYAYADGTAEGGANSGSNFQFAAYSDAGALLGQVYNVVRSTQIVTFVKAIVNGPSDRTLKENITPLEGSLAKVLRLQGVAYNLISDEIKRRYIGLIAQDVQPVVPEVIQQFQSYDGRGMADEGTVLALDYPKLVALLIEAIKELNAKLEKSPH